MSDHTMKDGTQDRHLDARPDRIDFRDLPYRPPLVSLPPQFPSDEEVQSFLPLYLRTNAIRHQGSEGACTGFGLATCIDYITWDRIVREGRETARAAGLPDKTAEAELTRTLKARFEPVSAFMLYDAAKMYDEWEGEDYSGSSCRGALKGWHKHGVCLERHWRTKRREATPHESSDSALAPWRKDAASRPLGAYYRVEARSISDMQAAIHEVRAVYCSARIHDGWKRETVNSAATAKIGNVEIPLIPFHRRKTGGHAFAMVGYTVDGFIIQNSWGRRWGRTGFAILRYEDWIENGNDAWVAALGAPISVSGGAIPMHRTSAPLALTATLRARDGAPDAPSADAGPVVRPWSADEAYNHAIVLGNDGKILRRRIDTADAAANLRAVAYDRPLGAAKANGGLKVLLYAHGGLNSEGKAIERAMSLGPWMRANGIYPIFLVWRTSLLETLGNIKADFIAQFQGERDSLRAEGLGALVQSTLAKLESAFDKTFEVTAETTIGKPLWSQMKQNAAAAADNDGGTRALFATLADLRQTLAAQGLPMEIHLAGHSAGAILLGHMLDDFDKQTPANSVTLLAPACTMKFAVDHYGRAFERGALPEGRLRLHALSDENERADTVGPYRKSLLYLVSRALETPRKQPLLGLARCLDEGNEALNAIDAEPGSRQALETIKSKLSADYAEAQLIHLRDWRAIAKAHSVSTWITREKEFVTKVNRFAGKNDKVHSEQVKIAATHGGFDNSTTVMNDLLLQVLGSEAAITHTIDDLTGF